MLDPHLAPEDKEWVIKFTDAVEEIVKTTGIHSDLNLFVIADSIGLDLSVLHKEGTLMYALWVALLYVMKSHLTMEDFKYQTCEEFLEAYDGRFSSESEKEKNYLFQTANWMHVLFKMITARKNKGLALQVIPKVVEGFDVKYVTGSGQTKATANRVHVFEVEGNTKANQRGKIRAKKKVVPGEKKVKLQDDFNNDEEPEQKKARKKRSPKLPMLSSFVTPYDTSDLGTRSREKRTREAIATMYEAAIAVESRDLEEEDLHAAEEEGSIAADVQKAYYKLMRDSSCSSVLSYTRDLDLGVLGGSGVPPYDYSRDFSRGISLGGLDPLNFIQLTGPSELQRGFSWTEIPVNTHVSQYSGFGGSQQPEGSSSSSNGGGNFDYDANATSAEEQEAELEAAIAAAAAEDAAALKSTNSTDIDTISSNSSGSNKVLDRNLSSSSLADIFRDFSK